MANKAKIAKNTKQKLMMKNGNSPFKSVKYRNRCEICGRPRAYIGRFKLCRICFRERAMAGELPGVRKLTW